MNEKPRPGGFHRLTVVPVVAAFDNLDRIIAKAESHAAQLKFEARTLLEARLYPDMFNLIQQLQYTLYLPVDFARHFTAEAPPKVGYEEASFDDVKKSLALARPYLSSIDATRMDERAGAIVPLFFDAAKGMPAEDYAARIVMPDFYFHLTAAYAILRHNGVPLGKADYFGKFRTVPIG